MASSEEINQETMSTMAVIQSNFERVSCFTDEIDGSLTALVVVTGKHCDFGAELQNKICLRKACTN